MAGLIETYLPLIVALFSLVFLFVRLQLFSSSEYDGRPAIVAGGLLVLLATIWQPIKTMSVYSDWFISSAYSVIDLIQVILLLLGILFVLAGVILHVDFWRSKREFLQEREDKASVLSNLQHDAREPYQFLELLNISLREIMSHLTGCGGVVFLVNRGRRQLVLATSSGLRKAETAGLEQYPFGGNMVTQSIELGEPMIGGLFEFTGRHTVESRYQSHLVLPMVSGMDKVGAIVLMADRRQAFSRSEIAYLAPVAEWLAEKVKSARLARELTLTGKKMQTQQTAFQDFSERLNCAGRHVLSSGDLNAFCRALVGLVASDSVQLGSFRDGALDILAESEPLDRPSESFRVALAEVLGGNKPLIINQESAEDDSSHRVVQSTLVFPIVSMSPPGALLLRRVGSAIEVSDDELIQLEPFALLTQLALRELDNYNSNFTRRAGIDRILELLHFSDASDGSSDGLRHLAELIRSGLPGESYVTLLDADLKVITSTPGKTTLVDRTLAKLRLSAAEGCIGRAALSGQCEFLYGNTQVAGDFESYGEVNSKALTKLYQDLGTPSFMAACPVMKSGGRVGGMVVVFVTSIDPIERGEWERFLTLAVGLYSLRLTVSSLKTDVAVAPKAIRSTHLTEVTNRLNNALAAVIGKTELAASDASLPEIARNRMSDILSDAEHAASIVRTDLIHSTRSGGLSEVPVRPSPSHDSGSHVSNSSQGNVVSRILHQRRIAGSLYMVGGKPREIAQTSIHQADINLTEAETGRLIDLVINALGVHAKEEEVFSVATYWHDDSLYLDICRHRKNFPSIAHVAGRATYCTVEDQIRHRPTDGFLHEVRDLSLMCAVDPVGSEPAYYSIRLPSSGNFDLRAELSSREHISILAIDDQPVILDLIAAMGRAQGFRVTTAISGTEGLRLASENEFDTILTDLAMPDLSGLEVSRRLRKMGITAPIILVTGWEASLSPADLEASGITDVLYKPFRIEQLTDTINSSNIQPR